MTAPSITLTRLDVQRLERLIDSLDDTLPGKPNWIAPIAWSVTMKCPPMS